MATLDSAQIIAKTLAAVKLAQAKAAAFALGIPVAEAVTTMGFSLAYDSYKRWLAGSGGNTNSLIDKLGQNAQRIDAWIAMIPSALRGTDDVPASMRSPYEPANAVIKYTLERWVKSGKALADIANSIAGEATDASFFNTLAGDAVLAYKTTGKAVDDIVDFAKKAAQPTQWPWYAQAAVAGVGIFYASQIYRNFKGGK